MRTAVRISTVLLAGLLAGCAAHKTQPAMSTQGSTIVQTAQVTDVRDVTVRGGRPSGVGAFAGAVLGSVAGGMIGSGHGSIAAGIGGAVAGGMAGQHIEQSGKVDRATAVTVRFDSGETRTYQLEPGTSFRVGDTVKVTTRGGVTRITY